METVYHAMNLFINFCQIITINQIKQDIAQVYYFNISCKFKGYVNIIDDMENIINNSLNLAVNNIE